jgi:hypothetical protein
LPVAGWTGLVAVLVKLFDPIDAKGYLAAGSLERYR